MQFLYSHWTNLPINTRHKIAVALNIPKRGSTEVVENQIKNDGYYIKDIETALSIDALQVYINTNETDFAMLWMWLLEKVEGKELSQPRIDTTARTIEAPQGLEKETKEIAEDFERLTGHHVEVIKPKRGRKPKAK